MRKVYLICNAHIDPMWLWEWEEGAAAAVSTFRSAVGFCEEHDAFVFNHNEALLYRWIEEYEPALFARIQRQVRLGRWHITGGWYLQPDCQIPGGEGFVRQILQGNRYFAQKFGITFKTAVNFDSFGHTRGLVQIMRKCGYENYLVCRPIRRHMELERDDFIWTGFDGSEILTRRHFELYNSDLGRAAEKIEALMQDQPGEQLMILWGVGNHGGGPSRKDIADIDKLIAKYAAAGTELVHTTTDTYFTELDREALPKVNVSLRPSQPGCLSSMAGLKQKYRETENLLFSTEKMASAASARKLMEYPGADFAEATADLLIAQFHDVLPGSGIKSVEEAGFRVLCHAQEILSRIRAKSFFALAADTRCPQGYPVLVYNPHPRPVRTTVECEFNLADHNWTDTLSMMKVYDEEGVLHPSQIEKEMSNLNLDWRKRVVFDAELAPMSISAFSCRPYLAERKEAEVRPYVFEENSFAGSLKLCVHRDSSDAWAMPDEQVEGGLGPKIGEFTPMTPEECMEYAGVDAPIPALRVIEDGPVRMVVEGLYKYNHSSAQVLYLFGKGEDRRLEVWIHSCWNEKDRALKLHVPAPNAKRFRAETAYGTQEMELGERETSVHKWCRFEGEGGSVSVVNDGIYAASVGEDMLMLTLVRSPAYTGHFIENRDMLRQDRFTERMEQGVRDFRFLFLLDGEEGEVANVAQTFNERPFALSFSPCGGGEKRPPLLTLEGGNVLLTALKEAEDGNGFILRLFNPLDQGDRCTLAAADEGIREALAFGKYEIRTFRLARGKLTETDLKESV